MLFRSSLLFVVLPKNRIPSIFSFVIIALLAGKYKRRLDNFFTNEQLHRRNSHTVRNVKNGYLEASNVQAVDEMVDMIVTQRAYEMNSKAITASDEMLQQANNLRS